jgi:GAF domain-containing protein
MAGTLNIPQGASKREKYEALLPQIYALIDGESDLIANLANISAALKEGMGFHWVGFYLVRRGLPLGGKNASKGASSEGELVLGPFQGPVACTRIPHGKGVCGKAWAEKRVLIVPDVEKFPGHIACSSLSKSEIVVPFYLQPEVKERTREIVGVLDVDSARLEDFNGIDEEYLVRLVERLAR